MLALTAVYVGVGLALIAKGAPLSHDEAVYGLHAATLATDMNVAPSWADYRAPGFPALLSAAWLFGGSEPYLRSIVLATGAGGIWLTWLLGRQLFNRVVGVIAATFLALTPNYLNQSVLVHPDVPGAALGLAVLVFFIWMLQSRRPWAPAALMILTAAAATYVRFGAPIPIAVGLVVLALLRWDQVIARIHWVIPSAVTMFLIVMAILWLPFPTQNDVAPAIAVRTLTANAGHPFHRSFIDLGRAIPSSLGSFLGPLVLVGLIALIPAVSTNRIPRRPTVATLAAATLTGLALALALAHGEPRYLMPVLPFLWISAAAGAWGCIAWFGSRSTAFVGLPLMLLALYLAINDGNAAVEHRNRYEGAIREISRHIGARSRKPCAVVTGYGPQVTWYSGCAMLPYIRHGQLLPLSETTATLSAEPEHYDVYVLVVRGGKHQPQPSRLDTYLEDTMGPVLTAGDPSENRLGAYARAYTYIP